MINAGQNAAAVVLTGEGRSHGFVNFNCAAVGTGCIVSHIDNKKTAQLSLEESGGQITASPGRLHPLDFG